MDFASRLFYGFLISAAGIGGTARNFRRRERMSSTYSDSFVTGDRRWARGALRLALAIGCVLGLSLASYGQSTFGTVLGTVKDPSGSAVPMAKVSLMNTGTNVEHSAITNSEGSFT